MSEEQYYMECIQHGEDAEQYVITLSKDEFDILTIFAEDGFLSYDGILDLPLETVPSDAQRTTAEFILSDTIWEYDRRADLRPSEISAAKRDGRRLTLESFV